MSQPLPAEHTSDRILIACIGNIFFGDDGFGVEVAQRLLSRQERLHAEHVQITDFGIRGLELAYTLLDDDYDTLVLVDAIPHGGSPGTLYLIEPNLANLGPEQGVEAARVGLDSHSMDPLKVLAFARTLGAKPIRTLLVGCEPSNVTTGAADEEMQMGLSQPVLAAVDGAVDMVDSLVERLLK
jgi:hydrogenase maturation protease